MGVDRSTHVVFGWKLSGKLTDKNGKSINVYEDEFLRYVEGWSGERFTIIYDQMMGGYTVFGLWLASLTRYDEGYFLEIDVSKLDPSECIDKFHSVFGFYPESEPKVLAFIHCS